MLLVLVLVLVLGVVADEAVVSPRAPQLPREKEKVGQVQRGLVDPANIAERQSEGVECYLSERPPGRRRDRRGRGGRIRMIGRRRDSSPRGLPRRSGLCTISALIGNVEKSGEHVLLNRLRLRTGKSPPAENRR